MGLYRKGNVWYAALTVDGRKINRSTRTSNKRRAQRVLDSWRGDAVEGQFNLLKTQSPTLKDYLERFLETVQHESTKERYGYSAETLKDFFGTARLQHLSVARIEEFKRHRLASGVKSATVNRDLALLRQLLRQATRERYLARSPFEDGNLFLNERKDRRQPYILSFADEEKLVAVCPSLLRALVRLLVETGLRSQKEALRLKWEDVDFAEGTIRVRDSKTLAGRRVVPMSELCRAELLRWQKLMGPEFSSWVFPNLKNPDASLGAVRKSWKSALKKAGLPGFPIYNLRAVFATRLSAAGTADNQVAGLLGHSSASIVHTYAKVVDEFRRGAIQNLEKLRERQPVNPTPTSISASSRIN